jgi:hypothetical protein
MMGYPSKVNCFAAQLKALAPSLPVAVVGSAANYILTQISKYGGGGPLAGTVWFIGNAAISTTVIFKAYDLCNDQWCTATRQADTVDGFLGSRCTCLNGKGGEDNLHKIGDRRSP